MRHIFITTLWKMEVDYACCTLFAYTYIPCIERHTRVFKNDYWSLAPCVVVISIEQTRAVWRDRNSLTLMQRLSRRRRFFFNSSTGTRNALFSFGRSHSGFTLMRNDVSPLRFIIRYASKYYSACSTFWLHTFVFQCSWKYTCVIDRTLSSLFLFSFFLPLRGENC